ncbi:SH3 domain-containing protein [Paraburkholderia terricola]|uniref:SH3 domain-containing protein n=1 Tax=Paraburkholderia terricola TaxID=169427 RepID=UPI001FD20CEF|nr:SH3 domain-containing protein [Paraburkholderia terricola]
MKQHLVRCICTAAGLLALPAAVCAQSQAYTNGPVNVRAGPAPDYPIVTQLPGGVPVSVMGCLSNYEWCDVAAPNLRGWVYAARLSYPYQGSNVPLINYGLVIGLPIVTFSIGSYWGNYYRGRPWYGQQSRWVHHPPPPPPRPGAGRPPGWRPSGGPPPGHSGGRPPGDRPPGHVGGRPSGDRPHGNVGGRPPGGSPQGHGVGRPSGDRSQGNAGGRQPSGQPREQAGGRHQAEPSGNRGGGSRGAAQGGGGGRPQGGPPPGGANRPPGGGNSGNGRQ